MIISKQLHFIGKMIVIILSLKLSLCLFKSAGIYAGEVWFEFPTGSAKFFLGAIAIYTICHFSRKLFLHFFSVEESKGMEEKKDGT